MPRTPLSHASPASRAAYVALSSSANASGLLAALSCAYLSRHEDVNSSAKNKTTACRTCYLAHPLSSRTSVGMARRRAGVSFMKRWRVLIAQNRNGMGAGHLSPRSRTLWHVPRVPHSWPPQQRRGAARGRRERRDAGALSKAAYFKSNILPRRGICAHHAS